MKGYPKRRDIIDIGERSDSQFFYGMEMDPFQREGFARYNPNDYAHRGYETGRNMQLIGGLVRKLNCGASKKQDYDIYHKADDYGDANSITEYHPKQSFPPHGKEQPKREINRPVLITVNNGDRKQQLPVADMNFANFEHFNQLLSENNQIFSQNNQFQDHFGGELLPPSKMCTRTPSFKRGMSARKRQQNAPKYFHNDDYGQEWPSNNKLYDVEESQRRRAAQEAARRERWKRGLEMENRMIKGGKARSKPSTARYRYQDDNSSSTDSLTEAGTSTTGSEDSSTDWTDSSDVQHSFYNYPGQCTDSALIAATVAEDVGTIAKFILADGVACLGTAAKITKETAASCKGPEPAPKPVVRRPERRRWGRKRS